MLRNGRWFLGAVLLGFVLFASQASAQTNAALAETLFQEGKRLMEEHKYAEACPKLQESQRLDPGTGTLLNYGLCLKELGKPASAWVVFNEAQASARAENRADRAALAKSEIDKLAAIMPRISVVVPTDSDAPGLVVTLDGSTISVATRGVATPVDPGDHVVTASAPQRKKWTTTVSVPAAAQTYNVVVPVLELGNDTPPPPSGAIALAPAGAAPEAEKAPDEGRKLKRFVLGLRLNGSIPAGHIEEDLKLSSYSKAQGTLWLEAGYRIKPAFMLGGFLSVGAGSVGDLIKEQLGCGADGISCSTMDVRLGLQATYHFDLNSALPWLGAGIGYEVLSLGIETADADLTLDAAGAEWLLLQGGLDFAVKQMQFGPFLAVSFARFTNGSCSGDCVTNSFDIENPEIHQWIMIGARGTIGL